jgi:hypothetical protein
MAAQRTISRRVTLVSGDRFMLGQFLSSRRSWFALMLTAIALTSSFGFGARAQAQGEGSAGCSADPTVNQLLAGGPGTQGKPRVVATRDGGAYVAWFSSVDAPNYWQFKLTKLDPCGRREWPADLVLADNPQTVATGALIEFDLRVDNQDHAIIALTDFRGTASNRNVFAYRVSPAGVHAWNSAGVRLSDDNLSKGNPRIVQTSDGAYTVMWSRLRSITPPIPAGLMFQRLDASGTLLLDPAGVRVIGDEAVNQTPNLFEMVPSDAGSVAVVYIRDTRTSSSPRHVHAQKLSPAGARLWNSGEPVVLWDQTSLPNSPSARPKIISDDAGGVVAVWAAAVSASATTEIFYGWVTSIGTTPLNDGVPNGPAFTQVNTGFFAGGTNLEPVLFPMPRNPLSPNGIATGFFWRRVTAAAPSTEIVSTVMEGRTTLQSSTTYPVSITERTGLSAWRSRSDVLLTHVRFDPLSPNDQVIDTTRLAVQRGSITLTGFSVPLASTPSLKNLTKHPLDSAPDASILRDAPSTTILASGDLLVGWCDRRDDSGAGDVLLQRVNGPSSGPALFGLPTCRADINFDRFLTVRDIFDFVQAWFEGARIADFDCSGGPPTTSDLFAFLAAWFDRC